MSKQLYGKIVLAHSDSLTSVQWEIKKLGIVNSCKEITSPPFLYENCVWHFRLNCFANSLHCKYGSLVLRLRILNDGEDNLMHCMKNKGYVPKVTMEAEDLNIGFGADKTHYLLYYHEVEFYESVTILLELPRNRRGETESSSSSISFGAEKRPSQSRLCEAKISTGTPFLAPGERKTSRTDDVPEGKRNSWVDDEIEVVCETSYSPEIDLTEKLQFLRTLSLVPVKPPKRSGTKAKNMVAEGSGTKTKNMEAEGSGTKSKKKVAEGSGTKTKKKVAEGSGTKTKNKVAEGSGTKTKKKVGEGSGTKTKKMVAEEIETVYEASATPEDKALAEKYQLPATFFLYKNKIPKHAEYVSITPSTKAPGTKNTSLVDNAAGAKKTANIEDEIEIVYEAKSRRKK